MKLRNTAIITGQINKHRKKIIIYINTRKNIDGAAVT
jgi:hypothetical protein